MEPHRDSTPLKRQTAPRSTEPASPVRTSRSASVSESRLNLQFWGQSFLSENRGRPINLIDLENERIFEIYSGETHLFINTKSKNIYGYGDNRFRQIENGAGKEVAAAAPLDIATRIPVTKIFCGCDYSYLLGSKTRLFAWGANVKGQLGLGHNENVSEPTPVRNFLQLKNDFSSGELPDGEHPVDVHCGSLHALVLTNRDRLFSTGFGETFALGHGTAQSLNTLKEVTYFSELGGDKKTGQPKIEAGVTHSGYLVGKKLYVWGMMGSDRSQLAKKPTCVNTNGDVVDFFLGDMLTVALNEAGEVWALGDNIDDQLASEATGPVRVPIPGKIEYIAGGLNHTFAVNFSKGKIFAWGSNRFGQILPTSTQSTFKSPTEMTWLYQNGSFALTCKGNSTFFVSKSRIRLDKDQPPDSNREKQLSATGPLPLSPSLSPPPTPAPPTAELRQLTAEVESKGRAIESLTRENQSLREEISRLSAMLTSSTKVSSSTSDPSDTNVEINDRELTSHRAVQAPTQKGKDPQAVLRNRLQRDRNLEEHRGGRLWRHLQGPLARDDRRRQNSEAGADEGRDHQGLPVWD